MIRCRKLDIWLVYFKHKKLLMLDLCHPNAEKVEPKRIAGDSVFDDGGHRLQIRCYQYDDSKHKDIKRQK